MAILGEKLPGDPAGTSLTARRVGLTKLSASGPRHEFQSTLLRPDLDVSKTLSLKGQESLNTSG